MSDMTFTITDYDKKPAFASFLPGLAGLHGIPIWCYYVNRGQCIASFGVEDKDHAIMEFFPAQQSYEHTALRGFRTFVRLDGRYLELFTGEDTQKQMTVGPNSLAIQETDAANGLDVRVDYITLPEEKTGALVRKVTLRSKKDAPCALEVLDGMPVVIPFGVDMGSVKEMGHTSKAWMQAEKLMPGVPYFRVRASMADTACVTAIAGGNYGFACDGTGERLPVVTDPSLVFGYDCSMQKAVGFSRMDYDAFLAAQQVDTNQYPCCFFAAKRTLQPGESLTLYEVIGQVGGRRLLERLLEKRPGPAYFEEKFARAAKLPEELCQVIGTKTADAAFDAYSSYTYMDNVLRGGFPIRLPGDHIFYAYSRKHGDLERDYNYFRMLPEYYSQGNGNFRDVNQNRRCDAFFTPYVGAENIVKFYSLIQLDGYNPLAIEKVTYTLPEEAAEEIFDRFTQEQKEELLGFLGEPFTPGAFFAKLDELGIRDVEEEERYFAQVMGRVHSTVNADFGEGYWSDHWTYNLDLIEAYLKVFPEKEKEILFETPVTFYRSQAAILPRKKRYVKTENGVRQYHFLDEGRKAGGEKLLRDRFGQGEVVEVTVMEKLLLLCAAKYAALDAYGCGVEMEGGKPGWYDALNGLPGLFGSSMAETYELERMVEFVIRELKTYRPDMELLAEVAGFLEQMGEITLHCREDIQKEEELLEFWNLRNDAKEAYWEKTFAGISGARASVDSGRLLELLQAMQETLLAGIRKACAAGKEGICPTYFTYEVKEFAEDGEGIVPLRFEQKNVPLFLEGPVRFFKLEGREEEKRRLYEKIKESDLYDEPLQMYKVNASLAEASIELGRAKAFTPGWLENESIWLHMEYKYLLELLRNGMYEEFFSDFKKAAIPFQDPERYGRSIYENSSFLASSKNPDKSCHGRGFVARLSGSTVEFLSMWVGMMFGELFSWKDGELTLSLTPALPAYLLGEEKRVEAVLLGNTRVIYETAQTRDYFPGNYSVERMELTYRDKSSFQTCQSVLAGETAKAVRDGKIETIYVKLV